MGRILNSKIALIITMLVLICFPLISTAQEEVEKAISELNGQEHMGRNLRVNIAKPQERRPKRNFNSGGGGRDRRY